MFVALQEEDNLSAVKLVLYSEVLDYAIIPAVHHYRLVAGINLPLLDLTNHINQPSGDARNCPRLFRPISEMVESDVMRGHILRLVEREKCIISTYM